MPKGITMEQQESINKSIRNVHRVTREEITERWFKENFQYYMKGRFIYNTERVSHGDRINMDTEFRFEYGDKFGIPTKIIGGTKRSAFNKVVNVPEAKKFYDDMKSKRKIDMFQVGRFGSFCTHPIGGRGKPTSQDSWWWSDGKVLIVQYIKIRNFDGKSENEVFTRFHQVNITEK